MEGMTMVTKDSETLPVLPLSPLFTNLPLASFGCRYTASPISTRPESTMSPIPSQATTPSESLSRSSSQQDDSLCFAKIPIPPRSAGAFLYQSTDSENVSSDWDLSSRQGYGGSRSPSLLTSLIQARPQPPRLVSNGFSNSSCQATPVTPLSNATATTFFRGPSCINKPILRRCSASAYTSASEDGIAYNRVGGLALNLGSILPQAPDLSSTSTKPSRSCALKFAVNPCISNERRGMSDSADTRSTHAAHISRHGSRRRDNHLPVWEDEEDEDKDDADEDDEDEDDDDDSPFVDAESESDEGYREDEEDGFTSDEEGMTSSVGPSRRPSQVYSKQIAWAESSNWASGFTMIAGSTATSRRKRQSLELESTELSDHLAGPSEALPHPLTWEETGRGRQVRVKDALGKPRSERCTRHRSPPPKSLSPAPAPPAARSPSAAELCRRRTGGLLSPTPGVHNSKGWRSDDPACATFRAAIDLSLASVCRQTSLPPQKTCSPILCRTPTAPSLCLPESSTAVSSSILAYEQRRTIEPEVMRRSSLPSEVLLSDSPLLANGEVESVAGMGQGQNRVKSELERALGIKLRA